MAGYENKLTIKSWAEDERPREKLLLKGKSSLTDPELLAILIGSGSQEETAVALCQRILADQSFDLQQLGRLSVHQLMHYKGIGEAKAITIVAALELSRRRQAARKKVNEYIKGSVDIANMMMPLLGDLPHEEFHAMYLSRNNKILHQERISQGGIAGTVADIKIILKNGVNLLASGLIVCHNHPSGNLNPSHADIQLTQKLKEAGLLLDIQLLDHLIITDQGYYSFADEGRL